MCCILMSLPELRMALSARPVIMCDVGADGRSCRCVAVGRMRAQLPRFLLICQVGLLIAAISCSAASSYLQLSSEAYLARSPRRMGPYAYHNSPECSSVGPFCEAIPTLNADIRLQRCTASQQTKRGWHPRLSRTGSFVFQRPVPISEAGRDIFRIRMVGHEILQLDMHICNWSVVVAPYHVRIGGAYQVQIMHLYENFTYSARPTPRPHQQMHLADLLLQFFSRDEEKGCAWDDACPFCPDGEAPGRWIARSPALLGQLSHCHTAAVMSKHGPSLCGEVTKRLAVNRSGGVGMEWQPYECKVQSSRDVDIPACTRGRKFCFVGDSQMRYAMLGVTAVLLQDSTWHEWEVPPGHDDVTLNTEMNEQTEINRNTHGAHFSEYYPDRFGWEPYNDLSSCSHVLMNFGQWPSSFVPGEMWPLSQYHLAVENAANVLLSLRQLGLKVYWVATNSHNILMNVTGVFDWRSEPVIAMYNQLSYSAMHSRGIPIIDLFHLTSPLHDLAFDGSHFKGMVGYHADLRIMNELCRLESEKF